MLKGSLIAITSGLGGEASSDETGELSFTKLKGLVKSLGATVAPTVHKRVNFLVCGGSAADRNTQKVRKARRFKIKVVKAEYLDACIQAKKRLPLDEFIIQPDKKDDEEEQGDEEREEKRQKEDTDDQEIKPKSKRKSAKSD